MNRGELSGATPWGSAPAVATPTSSRGSGTRGSAEPRLTSSPSRFAIGGMAGTGTSASRLVCSSAVFSLCPSAPPLPCSRVAFSLSPPAPVCFGASAVSTPWSSARRNPGISGVIFATVTGLSARRGTDAIVAGPRCPDGGLGAATDWGGTGACGAAAVGAGPAAWNIFGEFAPAGSICPV